jgi:DNA-binding winged helix-turn-helix (wHTH) protein
MATVAPVTKSVPQPIYRSGQVEVDTARRELRVRGEAVPIGGRAFEIVEALVLAAGELVTKDDLMRHLWRGAIVEESTLWVHISVVRKVLGSERGMLKTVARHIPSPLGRWATSR